MVKGPKVDTVEPNYVPRVWMTRLAEGLLPIHLDQYTMMLLEIKRLPQLIESLIYFLLARASLVPWPLPMRKDLPLRHLLHRLHPTYLVIMGYICYYNQRRAR
jgi:hypothetical protein